MNYKKIIVFILIITMLSSISLALEIKDSTSGVDFQLYLDADGKLYGIGGNDQGELGMGDSGETEYDELVEITTDVLLPEIGDSLIKRTIAAGADFTVIIKSDKKAYATGENYFGQLGTGDTNATNTFAAMQGDTENANIVSVSAGADYVLLLNESGEVYGAGDNGFGQIVANGEASYSTLTEVYKPEAENKKAIAIATGSRHSIILLKDGSVITLGDNEYNQKNITVPKGRKIAEIAAGGYHTLVRLDDNTVWGVGNNEEQQIAAHIGGGNILDQYRSTMTQLLDEDGKAIKVHNPNNRIRNMAAGFDFSLIITKGKDNKITVIGMGNKYRNQLGKEATTKSKNAVKIETIDTIENINAGWRHTVIMGKDKDKNKTESKGNKFYGEVGLGKPIKEQGVKTVAMGAGHSLYVKDNVLYGAGANTYGQLGLESYSSSVRKVPFNVEAVGGIKQIAAGAAHSIILGFDGSVWGAGYNYSGQLGLGDNVDRKVFTKINYSFDSPVIAVAAGGDTTMILTQNGTVYAMGDNSYGQINEDAAAPKTYNTPTIYSEGEQVIQIGVGVRYTVILKADNKLETRGQGVEGLDGKRNVDKFAVGAYHILASEDGMGVVGIGRNDYGQLGVGDTYSYADCAWLYFQAGVEVKDMVAGYTHSLFLTNDGIYIAGNIAGNTDIETNKLVPTKYADIIDAKEIATGWFGNIIKTATSIVTVGNNTYGQRGSHRGEESSGYDEEIASLSKKKVAAGDGFTIVLHSDGTLWGIGKNDKGQLGIGDNNDKGRFVKINTPVAAGNIADVKTGPDYTLLLTKDGDVYGTGKNYYRLFGDMATVTSVNRFVKLDIDNVKKMSTNSTKGLGEPVIFILKNDGTLWALGTIITGGMPVSYEEFTMIPIELQEGKFIKNINQNGPEAIIIISDDTVIDSLGNVTGTKQNDQYIFIFSYNNNSIGIDIELKEKKVYITKRAGTPDYEVEADNEIHMVTTEGTNELDVADASKVVGTKFTEEIESVAASDTHVIVLTKSGQIYSAGSNENGLLGNETLNERGITSTRVFVPTYIQSIAPTVGGVVK